MIRSHFALRLCAQPGYKRALKMTFLWGLLALLLHLVPGAVDPAHGQGTRKDDIVFNSRGVPLAGATVRVCVMPASGQPCTPLALIYSDSGLTQALANPTTTDGLGNYFFYAAPGKYEIEISGPGITTKQIPNILLPNDPSSPTFTGAVSAFSLNLTGNLSVTGNTTVLGDLASGTLNLTNQSTPPGAAGTGTVNLYTKTLDKRLYYKDETGTEIGPLGSGGSPGGTNTQVQVNNSGTLGGSPCLSFPSLLSGPVNVACDPVISGPDPYVDVRKYGLVSGSASTTATISSGSTSATLASGAGFANGNGFVLYGAGPANTMTTPNAPIVTPGQASNFTSTGSGQTVAAPSGGSTSFSYQLVADDCAGGLTAASAVGSTSAGFPLGEQTATITSYTRSGTTVTATTSANHGLAPGALVSIQTTAGSDITLNGTFQVASTPTSTTFTFNSGISTVGGAPANGTPTATVYYFNVNHLTWTLPSSTMPCRYWVYGRTGGSITRLGVSEISGANGVTSLQFNDYGSPYNDNFSFPSYIPSTPPASATNDWLAGTITAGGGTTSVTLSVSAGNSVANGTFQLDNTVPFENAVAANCNGAPLYFAASQTFVFNSTMTLSCGTSIQQAGQVTLNEPWFLSHFLVSWRGDINPQAWTIGTSQLQPSPIVNINLANPGLYAVPTQSINIVGIHFNGLAANNNRLMIIDASTANTPIPSGQISNSYFSTAGSTDYMSQGLIIRASTGSVVTDLRLQEDGFSSGPNQTTAAAPTPMAQIAASVLHVHRPFFTRRTMAFTVLNQVEIDGVGYDSGATMPAYWFSALGAVPVSISNLQLDTTFFAVGNYSNAGATPWSGALVLKDISTAGSANLTGQPFANVVVHGSAGNLGQNINICQVTGSISCSGSSGVQAAASGTVGYALPIPAAPTVVTGAHGSCSSNCVNSGTWFYALMAEDVTGRNSPVGAASSAVTVDGTQTVTVSFAPVAGQAATIEARAFTSLSNMLLCGIPGPASQGGAGSFQGTSFVDTTSGLGSGCTVSNTYPTPGNTSGLNAASVAGPELQLVNGTYVNTLSGTFTANRTQTLPDLSGYVPVTSYINSAYDNATRANGAIGANWTVTNSGINIASNSFQGVSTNNNVAFWNTNPFAADQFAEVAVVSLNATTDFDGPAVRVSSGNWYSCVESATSLIFQRSLNGTTSNIATVSVTGNTGDVLRTEVQGSTVKCYQNGVLQITQPDTNLTSGSPGMELFGDVATLKNWSGGNLHPLAQLDAEQDWTKTQHFTQGVAVGTETFSASPRGVQSVFLPGALTSTWTGSTWTLDKAVSVTRVQVQTKTAPSGCTTNATVRLSDGASPVSLVISAAANDSGPIVQNYAAGASLTVAVQTAAAGCTTSPADANVIVQYRMQ